MDLLQQHVHLEIEPLFLVIALVSIELRPISYKIRLLLTSIHEHIQQIVPLHLMEYRHDVRPPNQIHPPDATQTIPITYLPAVLLLVSVGKIAQVVTIEIILHVLLLLTLHDVVP